MQIEDELNRFAERLGKIPPEQFQKARPFPYIEVYNALSSKTISTIHEMLKTLPTDYWQKSNDQGIEVKWRSNWESEYSIPEPAREIVRFLNSGKFLRILSEMTGIPNLIPDPYYTGGGFNLLHRGGMLDVHVDGNWHDTMAVHRRLNAILYLNQEWQDEWGGKLNFYDAEAKEVEASVSPRGNNFVIFETNDYSYHGHPDPLTSPDGQPRSSIILYYYTSVPRPSNQIQVERPHSALWRSQAWKDKRGQVERA